jgi:hypothetical protein
MAVVSAGNRFVNPQAYFGVLHEHITKQDLEVDTISAQVENWSRIDSNTSVVKYMPD